MKKNYFKNVIAILLPMLVAGVLASCGNNKPQQVKDTRSEDSLMRMNNQKDAEINSLLGTINDIQYGLQQITEAQGRVAELKGNPESSSADEIRAQMAFIQQTMTVNRQRIEELQSQLKSSNINADKLRETIESLQSQLNEKTKQIDKLLAELASKDIKIQEQSTQISSLNTEKANLTQAKENLTREKENLTQDKAALSQANEAKSKTINKQDKDLHRGWYVFGTKKELKEQKILNNGDVLTQGFNKNYLTEIDTRNLRSVPLYSKSAKLLTNHPSGSYTLDRDESKNYTLRITDPASFWSVSKYLVILVK